MIDGIISHTKTGFSKSDDTNYEAIRLQPFYLLNANQNNISLIGKGLFERGLHFSGTVTPTGVRNICICDHCLKSFTIQHFHAGFSEAQYFYSTDSRKTLFVSIFQFEDMPCQLQANIDHSAVKTIENKLPMPSNGVGTFNYYNSFKCPHCLSPYIDFEKYKEARPNEYYGNTYINEDTQRYEVK
jgi:hypothetical protein